MAAEFSRLWRVIGAPPCCFNLLLTAAVRTARNVAPRLNVGEERVLARCGEWGVVDGQVKREKGCVGRSPDWRQWGACELSCLDRLRVLV